MKNPAGEKQRQQHAIYDDGAVSVASPAPDGQQPRHWSNAGSQGHKTDRVERKR
ncbi:hypothetical protein [Planctellipticum variicoloris]|uniref:hypothetical protein n=1 Tax=Planctellipticum variicoloris TaxID=3064265 RepID=UPI003014150E